MTNGINLLKTWKKEARLKKVFEFPGKWEYDIQRKK